MKNKNLFRLGMKMCAILVFILSIFLLVYSLKIQPSLSYAIIGLIYILVGIVLIFDSFNLRRRGVTNK